MTPELLNFHQVISELQAAEDIMLDSHKQFSDQMHATVNQVDRLLRITDDVTYDQEGIYLLYLFIQGIYHLLRNPFLRKNNF